MHDRETPATAPTFGVGLPDPDKVRQAAEREAASKGRSAGYRRPDPPAPRLHPEDGDPFGPAIPAGTGPKEPRLGDDPFGPDTADPFATAGSVDDPAVGSRIARIGLFLLILGAWRLVPELLAWLGRLDEVIAIASTAPSLRLRALRESDPAGLWMLWPTLMGLILWRVPRRAFLPAATIAALALATDEAARLAMRFGFGVPLTWPGLAIGGRTPIAGWLSGAGLVLDLGVAILAWRVRRSVGLSRPLANRRRESRSRPAIQGRLAALLSIVFLGSVGYLELWRFYEGVVLLNPGVRTALAGPLTRRPTRFSTLGETPVIRHARQVGAAREQFAEAKHFVSIREYDKARRVYLLGVGILDSIARSGSRGDRFDLSVDLAGGLNDLAWMLATAEDPAARDPEAAVSLARRASESDPDDGNIWNTLGVALYRDNRLDEAAEALDRSMTIRDGGTPHDWYFLALIAHRKGFDEEAVALYNRAAAIRRSTSDRELARFDREVTEALGLPEPEPELAPINGLQDPMPVNRKGLR